MESGGGHQYLHLILLAAGCLLPAVVMTVQMLWLGRRRPDAPAPELTREEMRRHVLWRSFYVNPDDPRGWVPKVSGFGWTVNFRTRRNAAVFATLAAISMVNAVLLAVAVLR